MSHAFFINMSYSFQHTFALSVSNRGRSLVDIPYGIINTVFFPSKTCSSVWKNLYR